MAPLLALPNEVLFNIIEQLLPDDILHFALSCKLIQALSQGSLTLYRECKQKYSVVKFHGCPEWDSVSALPELLQHMSSDQRIAFYPRSMIFKAPHCSLECAHSFAPSAYEIGYRGNDNSNDEANQLGSIEKLNNIISNIGSESTKTEHETAYGRRRGGKVWLYDIYQWSTMLGLLLTAFPNLETLKFNFTSDLLGKVHDIVWNAVDKNRGPGHSGPTFLSNLKTVVVDASEHAGRHDFEVFACCALFPSVKRLVGKHIESLHPLLSNRNWTKMTYLHLWHPSLPVTEIIFQESELSYEFFARLLRAITRLKRFTYSYSFWWVPWARTSATDPYRLIDLLLLHSKSTLEYLELKGFDSKSPASPPRGTGYGCLRDFEALKEVRVDAAIWKIPRTHHRIYNSKPRGKLWEESIVFPLAEVLPSCIETVSLEGPCHVLGVIPLLKGLTTAKRRRLRSLKTIVLQNVVCPSALMLRRVDVWIEDCARMGIRLNFEWNRPFSDFTA